MTAGTKAQATAEAEDGTQGRGLEYLTATRMRNLGSMAADTETPAIEADTAISVTTDSRTSSATAARTATLARATAPDADSGSDSDDSGYD